MTALPDIDWVFVDDGSADATPGKLANFVSSQCEGGKSVSLLVLPTNVGKGEAVRAGWLSRSPRNYDAVGFLDADGAFKRQDVERIMAEFDAYVFNSTFDAVWSSRVALSGRLIERQTSRHYIGRVVATFLSMGGNSIPYDTQSGLKLFAATPSLWDSLESPFETRWLFEMEIAARYLKTTGGELAIWEMPLDYWRDIAGSKIGYGESIRIMRELIKVKSVQKNSRNSLPQDSQPDSP